MADQGESVTFILPSGEKQEFLIPSGMSDAAAKTYVLSKRPDLFQAKAPSFLDSANQAKTQLMQSKASPSMHQPDLGDMLRNEQAAGRVPPANPELQKLVPFVSAGLGATRAGALVQSAPKAVQILMKMAGAGGGGTLGKVAQQVSETGKSEPGPALATGGEMVAAEGVGETVVSPFLKWMLSSKSLGAKMLQAASAKAGDAPVALSHETNVLLDEITQQGNLGGQNPKVISDLLKRIGPSARDAADAAPGPLTYDEARILQSNASTLSVAEDFALKGRLRYLIPKFAQSFGRDIQAAADAAGVGSEHAIGMQEYAAAAGRNEMLKKIAKATPYIGGAAVGLKQLHDLVKK